jgi:putative ATP-binding cassette transporter
VKLVTGLYAPAEGEIFLGEHSITNDESQWYREHFAAVFSDFHLFDEFWGRDEASITEGVQSFIEAMELHKKVRLQGRQFSTTNLSSGERKRLALICAMIEARPVFVFDEWAADQDPRFRHIFYRVILPKLRDQNKTVIVVTHDDRYFDVADQLIKLDAGEQSLDQTASFMERLIGSQASG